MSHSAPASTAGRVGINSQAAGGGRRWLAATSHGRSEAAAAYLLLAPVLILFAIAVVFPLFDTIRLSFFDIKGLGAAKWVGIGNYFKLFADVTFRHSLVTTLIWTLAATALSVGIGWGLAVVCALAPKETLIFRVMFFATFGVSEAVSGFMWLGIFRPDVGGLLNTLIGVFGFAPHSWLGDVNTALGALIIAYSWTQVGLPLMVCFAATQAISKNVIEAAVMDGAGSTRLMRHIIAPLSMPGVRVSIFINLLGSLRAFDMIFVLTGGGPVRTTETVGYFMYRESMTQFKLGYGAAATVVLLVAILVVSIPAIIQRTAGAR